MTLEGVGEDATVNGWGILVRSATNVEISNIGVMFFPDDGISLDTDNTNIWVHNCDIFYGTAGSDADQAKGDGSIDVKSDSKYVTLSYNHFWDSGKSSLCGMTSESGDNYIIYHHNWFDHSDSRHPRVRTMSVHVYNNYYDGNSKYSVGATMGSSVFVENNYFRNCKYPMLISMQGSDIATGTGTFSSEDGGMIKAYGNYMVGQTAFVSYQEDSTEFDAYVATSRSEQVPSTVVTSQGGTSYNNFDTDSSIMYDYTPDDAEDVPEIVMANAGRLNGGDVDFTFDDDDDTDYSVNTELMAVLTSYSSSVIAIGSGFTDSTEEPDTTTTITTTTNTASTAASATTTAMTTEDVVTDGDIFCSPDGTGSGETASDPATVTDAISRLTAGHTIYLLEGTYEFSETIVISEDNCGTADAVKTIKAYNGADVVFDFSGQGEASDSLRGFVLDRDYWHFYGFEITKAVDNGMLLSSSNNTIERMIFNDNQDTGLQISRYNSSYTDIADWPSDNLILNCTSKNNCDDATMENVDGFAAKLTCSEGNVFDGCLAYNNSDDGWDLYAKTDMGSIGVVTIQNCIAARNGYTEFGEGYGDCDGNGFKLGGSSVGSAHIVINCLAFENLNCGFTDNNNPDLGQLINCTAINNGGGGNSKSNFSYYRCTDCDFDNLLSYYDTSAYLSDANLSLGSIANDKYVGTYCNGIYYNSGYYLVDEDTAVTNGEKIGTKFDGPSDSDFISVDAAPAVGEDLDALWRSADGTLNPGGFFETAESSDYYTMGYHMYNGDSPATTTTTTTNDTTTTTTTTTATATADTTDSSDDTTVTETSAGAQVHNFTLNGTESTFYTISRNLSTSKGTVSYAGLELTQCLKMETATSITFTSTVEGTLTLVFLEETANVYVDGMKYVADGDGIITITLEAGDHTVTKVDTANLYYMVYADNTTTETTTEATTTTTEITSNTDDTSDSDSTSTMDSSTTTTESTDDVTDDTTTTTETTTAGTTVAIENQFFGDVTLDGCITLADVILFNKAIAGNVELNAEAKANADVNLDGSEDADDALVLLKFLVQLIDTLPV
ncbi:MAG: right-handed parallel beta-helix repeat-containing protein [Ruminococcus sp.]|nr:right-handed parallel beta-helix repeat-containing protein [Ruminococcus sp.]